MKLQNKLTLSAAAVITVATTAVGWLSIAGAESREREQLANGLDRAASQIAKSQGQELDAALLVSQSSSVNLTVGFRDLNNDFTVIEDGEALLPSTWSDATLKSASKSPLYLGNSTHTLIRSVALPDDEWVILGTSSADIDAAKQSNLLSLFGIIGVADVLAVFLVWLLIRNDVRKIRRLIDEAGRIADGLDASLHSDGGSLEVARLSAALERMVERLVSNRDAMQQFLGDASHELRTPLTVIRGYLELLSNNAVVVGDPAASRGVTKMLAEATRMQQLINDLLLLAELGDQSATPESAESVDLRELIIAEVESLRDLQPERKVSVDAPGAATVLATRSMLARMSANLFANLRQHTPADAEVRVSISEVDDVVELIIADAGPGLAPEQYESSGQAFERFSKARDRAAGGSGLGMAISDGIVKRCGGRVSLSKSEELGGLKTTIWLPRK